MQTTLRIDDLIYREAKAEAARSGMTLTQFIEEALLLRLNQSGPRSPTNLPVCDAGVKLPAGFDLVKAIKEAEARTAFPQARSIERPSRKRNAPK